jgi:HTH-type transcriptional regulator, glycine betaine synthesis regulator
LRATTSTADRKSSADLEWRLVRHDGRSVEIVAFEEAVVTFFLESAALLGVPKSVASIYGICFASPEPLTFTEVKERLNISSGSISQGLRVLREVGALKIVRQEPDRQERFAPDMELRRLVKHFIEHRLQTQLASGENRLKAIARIVPRDDSGVNPVLKGRLSALQGWHDKTRAVLPLAKTFLMVG